MNRPLAALTLAAGLLLTSACSSDNISGDSNPGTQTDQLPADPSADRPEETTAP